MRPGRRTVLLGTLALLAGGPVRAELVDGMRLRGRSQLRWLGLPIYDAALWAAEPFNPVDFAASALRLELTYHRNFRSQAIVDRSLEEMGRGGPLPADRLPAWRGFLQQAIPDVQPGQRLAARWSPDRQALRLGPPDQPGLERVDAEFGPRFLGIWLAAHSTEPDLRRRLLGLA